MNIEFWILQAILRMKILSVVFTHGFRHDKDEMQHGIQKMGRIARPLVIVIAVLALMDSIGLNVPGAFGVLAWTTPFTAAILAGLMLLSVVFHTNCREDQKYS
jgi:hypothetical protein